MRLLCLLSALLCAVGVSAQTVRDALFFSDNQPMITARSMGVGGALGALGADISTINFNPAGLGVYRRADINFSMGGYNSETSTAFVGNNTRDRFARPVFGNLGLVIPARIYRSSDWKFVNFGFSFSRLANYGRNFSYSGISTGSRVLAFAERSAGLLPTKLDPYGESMAYTAYLINQDGRGNYVANGGITETTGIYKAQTVDRRGGVNALNLSIAGNYKHKLYLGATLGVNFLSFREDRYYQEKDPTGDLDFDNLTFREERIVDGVGLNFKLGILYRISKSLRVGLSVHTPTAYRLTDSYHSALTAALVYQDTLRKTEFKMTDFKPSVLQHDLATPWVFSGNFGVIIAKRGFIGVDVEYLDFSAANFSLLEKDRTPENNQFINGINNKIQDNYRGVFRARLGGEFSLGLVRFRLGYRLQTSPYVVSVDGVTDFRHDISAGVGLRWKHFYVDVAYNHTLLDFEYAPYATSIPNNYQRVTGNQTIGQVMLSIGAVIFRDN